MRKFAKNAASILKYDGRTEREGGKAAARQTTHFSEVLLSDLARIVAAWPTLPDAAKAAILAALGAAPSKS